MPLSSPKSFIGDPVEKPSSPNVFIVDPDQFLTFFVFRSDKIVIFTSLIYMESLFLHILHEVEIWNHPWYPGFPLPRE